MKIEQALRLASDLESFSPVGDRLTELLEQEDELDEDELEQVAAAAAKPTLKELLDRRR